MYAPTHTYMHTQAHNSLSQNHHNWRVEVVNVDASLLVAGTQPPVELVVQLIVVAEVEPTKLRPAPQAKGTRFMLDQLPRGKRWGGWNEKDGSMSSLKLHFDHYQTLKHTITPLILHPSHSHLSHHPSQSHLAHHPSL